MPARLQMKFLLAFVAIAALGFSADSPDARTIVERSVSRDQSNWANAQDYTMVERKVTRELDGTKVTSVKSTTHDLMFIGGERFKRLIARDDKPLSPEEQKKEEE